MKNKFTVNNSSEILVTSPWGLGILGLNHNNLEVRTMSSNNTRLGQWLLNTSDNHVNLSGDFDGDGKTEVLIRSPWGIGILKYVNGTMTSLAIVQNGTRKNGWIINTNDNIFLHVADFDHDGKEEILISSPWGIGVLKYANNDISTIMLAPNGTRFGEWMLNTGDNFSQVGDFDGDGKIELLVRSSWGIGVLKFNGTTFTSIAISQNNSSFGNWIINTETDRFEAVGDFDGDGKTDILISNKTKIGVLKLVGNTLVCNTFANNGSNLGQWMLDSNKDKMGVVGDFDGDGKSEILISNDWGIGILKLINNNLSSIICVQNGTMLGDFLLNTKDNRLNYVSDFDGDGKSEILISSPWGIGILKQNATGLTCMTIYPNGHKVGGWVLNTSDNDFEAGIGQFYGLLVYHDDWRGAVDNTATFLKNRGFIVTMTPNGADGIKLLKNMSLTLKDIDRLFLYFAGHGGSSREIGDMSKDIALTHILQFNDGALVGLDRFSSSLQLLGNKGIDLIVFDGSCDGGETVINAIGERYVALSTTSVGAPGITNTPDPSQIMKRFGKPNKFGLWWSQQVTGSLLTSKTPHRFYQKIYRNETTDIGRLALFYKPAISYYINLDQGGWDLKVRDCSLYKYIYPTDFNNLPVAEQNSYTVSCADFIAAMRLNHNRHNPSIVSLKNLLTNANLIDNAAQIYSTAYPKPWQTIFDDMAWDVTLEPSKHSSLGNALVAGSYLGTLGFHNMINEILVLIDLLAQSYERQESLLVRIDNKINENNMVVRRPVGLGRIKPRAITDYLTFNDFEKVHLEKQQLIIESVKLERKDLYQPIKLQPLNVSKDNLLNQFNQNVDVIRYKLKDTSFNNSTMNDLIAEFKAISVESYIHLDKVFYLLTIAEEAISCAQTTTISPGDLTSY